METSLASDIAQSQQAFVQQFNPNSSDYHHGDPTPVPVGGERVPMSMPTVYDKDYIKKSEESEGTNYGAEYEKYMELRTLFADLKKALNLVCPPIEAVLRIRSKPLEEVKKNEQIAQEMQKVELATSDISRINEVLKKTNYAEKYADGLDAIAKDAFRSFNSKDDYTNFLFFVKKFTALCFADSTDVLNRIKKIKGSYKPNA